MLDYERLSRQIALPEVGVAGQQRLCDTPWLPGDPMTADFHARSTGQPQHSLTVTPCVTQAPRVLALAAYACIEHARAVLQQPPCELPSALLERLATPRKHA
jgi:hypothetical protein